MGMLYYSGTVGLLLGFASPLLYHGWKLRTSGSVLGALAGPVAGVLWLNTIMKSQSGENPWTTIACGLYSAFFGAVVGFLLEIVIPPVWHRGKLRMVQTVLGGAFAAAMAGVVLMRYGILGFSFFGVVVGFLLGFASPLIWHRWLLRTAARQSDNPATAQASPPGEPAPMVMADPDYNRMGPAQYSTQALTSAVVALVPAAIIVLGVSCFGLLAFAGLPVPRSGYQPPAESIMDPVTGGLVAYQPQGNSLFRLVWYAALCGASTAVWALVCTCRAAVKPQERFGIARSRRRLAVWLALPALAIYGAPLPWLFKEGWPSPYGPDGAIVRPHSGYYFQQKPEASAAFNRGYAHYFKLYHSDAIDDFSEAIRLDPKAVMAFYYRGLAYANKTQYDRAIDDFTGVIRLNPNFTEALTGRASSYLKKTQYDKAIADYTELIRLKPDSAYALCNRADAYALKTQYVKAIDDYTEAIRLYPHNYEYALLRRGAAYRDKKEYDKAIKDCTEAIRLNPKCADAFGCRATTYTRMKDHDKAVKDFTEAVRLISHGVDGHNVSIVNGFAWLLATCPKDGVRDGKKAVELATMASGWVRADYFETLAAAYAECGNLQEAVKWQEKAIDLGTGDKAKAQKRLKLYQSGKAYRDE
jgi:tetratricopeptide (TPR) repeat protein